MNTFNYTQYLSENQLAENELDDLGNELAAIIKDKLEDKKDELNEVIDPLSILSYLLAGTTLTNILAKWVSKLFKKYNFGKGEEAANKIYDFTHKLEGDFKKPIERVVSLFAKDKKSIKVITDGLFILLLLGLGARAGTEAFNSLRKSSYVSAGIGSLKAGLKGKDIISIIKNIVTV